MTGSIRSPDDFAKDDFRRHVPRFNEENFPKNLQLVDKLNSLARKKGCTPGQLTLAFLLAQGEDIIPIPGTTKVKNFDENMGALKVKLTDNELKEIRQAIQVGLVRSSTTWLGLLTLCRTRRCMEPDTPRQWLLFSSLTPHLRSYRGQHGVYPDTNRPVMIKDSQNDFLPTCCFLPESWMLSL